jgi:hypothetical protein
LSLAAHNYHDTALRFPSGFQPGASGGASAICFLLPFLEQGNRASTFDFNQDLNSSAANAQARTQDVPVYLCPSDQIPARFYTGANNQATGRNNYMPNLGNRANFAEVDSGVRLRSTGIFFRRSTVRMAEITDGTSNTAMFSECKRGPNANVTAGSSQDLLVSTRVASGTWDGSPNVDTTRPSDCENRSLATGNYRGLQYYRGGVMWTGFYTHTLTPNFKGRDCVRDVGFDSGHFAARSYHPSSVTVAMCDGSIRNVNDSIDLATWSAAGSRGDGESLSLP